MKPNLYNFIEQVNFKSRPHVNSHFLFDWPGVFPVINDEVFGYPIIREVRFDGVKHQELKAYIDGHELPVNGTPSLSKSLSLDVFLEFDFLERSYGNILKMIYTDGNLGTTAGFGAHNFPGQGPSKVSPIARLYILDKSYKFASADDFTRNSHFIFHYPKFKEVQDLGFSAHSSSLTQMRFVLSFAWMNVVGKGSVFNKFLVR